MKLAVAWMVIVPCLVVRGVPFDAVETDLLISRPKGEALQNLHTVHQVSRRAGQDAPRLLERTVFGTNISTWPGSQEQPDGYRLYTTLYETQTTQSQFSKVKFKVEIVDGSSTGSCGDHIIAVWRNLDGRILGDVPWRQAKAVVMSSSPSAALAYLRSEARDILRKVQQAYVGLYRPQQAIDVEWSSHLGDQWTVQITTNEIHDFAYSTHRDVPDYKYPPTTNYNYPPFAPGDEDELAAGIAKLIVARALIELINRKLYEPFATFTLLDALYVKVALKACRDFYTMGLRPPFTPTGVASPPKAKVELALRSLGLQGGFLQDHMKSGQIWMTWKRYQTLLEGKKHLLCTATDQGTISTS